MSIISDESLISLGQQIQQQSKQNSPQQKYIDLNDLSFSKLEPSNNLEIGVDLLGNISNVLEKDDNLSCRVHRLLESDESYNEDKDDMAVSLSFHKLSPNKTQTDFSFVDHQSIEASNIFTRLEPFGIVEATPFHKTTPQQNQFDNSPPKSYKDVDKGSSVGNTTIASLDNTEYDELPNFIDLSDDSNININQLSEENRVVSKKKVGFNLDENRRLDGSYINSKSYKFEALINSLKGQSKDDDKLNLSLKPDFYQNDSILIPQKYSISKSAAGSNVLYSSLYCDKSPGILTNSITSDALLCLKKDCSSDKPNNLVLPPAVSNINTDKQMINHLQLDEDTLKILDPLQKSEENLNISQAMSNDSLARQVKDLLEVDSEISFDNEKIFKDKTEAEVNKSLNLSTALHEFENTELWQYVQQFMPCSDQQNQNLTIKNTSNYSGILESLDSPVKHFTKPAASHSNVFKDKNMNHFDKFSSVDEDLKFNPHKLVGTVNTEANYDLSIQQEEVSNDFDDYIKKTCENYLKEQKSAADGKNVSQNHIEAVSDANLFSVDQKYSPNHKNTPIKNNVEVNSASNHFFDQQPNNITKEAQRILDELVHVEDSIKKSLEKNKHPIKLSDCNFKTNEKKFEDAKLIEIENPETEVKKVNSSSTYKVDNSTLPSYTISTRLENRQVDEECKSPMISNKSFKHTNSASNEKQTHKISADSKQTFSQMNQSLPASKKHGNKSCRDKVKVLPTFEELEKKLKSEADKKSAENESSDAVKDDRKGDPVATDDVTTASRNVETQTEDNTSLKQIYISRSFEGGITKESCAKEVLANQQQENQQEPTIKHQQEPTIIHQQEPTIKYQQEPTIKYQQGPTIKYQQGPTIKHQQEPTIKYQQGPTIKHQQEPTIKHQQEPTRRYQKKLTMKHQQTPVVDHHKSVHSTAVQVDETSMNDRGQMCLPTSLEEFKSFDDESQTQIVKALLQLFEDEVPPEANFSSKYPLAASNNRTSAEQDAVQRLLKKIERQKRLMTKKSNNKKVRHNDKNVFPRKVVMKDNEKEKSFYLKLSAGDLQTLLVSRCSTDFTSNHSSKPTKSGRVFETSSPVQQMKAGHVIESLRRLLNK